MAYDGTAYHGWQVQPNGETVQEVLQHALTTILRQNIAVTGAGRTDTGVHASCFLAHFDLGIEGMDPTPDDESFIFKLNRFLPPDIVVYNIRVVPDTLHARFSATHRTYHYHISTIKPLFTRHYSHYLFGPLDLNEIGKCCNILLQAVDFTSFSKLHTDVKTNNCDVMVADWKEVENGYLFEIKADRFLRNMVRSIVGTLIDAGQGKINNEDFKSILEAKDRGKAGQSAPAAGLFLVDIGYEEASS
jgi:tRNA pseudouridine38-40 synthase